MIDPTIRDRLLLASRCVVVCLASSIVTASAFQAHELMLVTTKIAARQEAVAAMLVLSVAVFIGVRWAISARGAIELFVSFLAVLVASFVDWARFWPVIKIAIVGLMLSVFYVWIKTSRTD